MRISEIGLSPSPAPERVRLGARVDYADGTAERLYMEYPAECEGDIVTDGTPWLALLLPAAYWLGEPMQIEGPVDPELYWNMLQLQEIWRAWHGKPPVKISAELLPRAQAVQTGTRIAAYFTGGVDSLFTVMHADQLDGGRYKVDDLLCVAGMDIPNWRDDQLRVRTERLDRFAQNLGKRLLVVNCNVRNGRAEKADYALIAHGPMLASIGLGLGKAYGKLLLSSSYVSKQPSMHIWGSHPVTDPLFSTTGTRLVHYGNGFGRVEKTQFIAQFPAAMETLHVCFADFAAANCGQCVKCARTLACLDMLGALDKARTFPIEMYHPRLLCETEITGPSARYFMTELLAQAKKTGRRDIEWAVRYAFARQSCFGAPDVLHRMGRSVAKRLGLYKKPKHEFPWKDVPREARAEIPKA